MPPPRVLHHPSAGEVQGQGVEAATSVPGSVAAPGGSVVAPGGSVVVPAGEHATAEAPTPTPAAAAPAAPAVPAPAAKPRSNPFGGARPVDTTAKLLEIEEKATRDRERLGKVQVQQQQVLQPLLPPFAGDVAGLQAQAVGHGDSLWAMGGGGLPLPPGWVWGRCSYRGHHPCLPRRLIRCSPPLAHPWAWGSRPALPCPHLLIHHNHIHCR